MGVKSGGIKYLSSCTGEKKSIQNSIFAFSVDEFLFWDPVEPQKWFIRVAWCNIYYPLFCQEGNLVACYHSTQDLKEFSYVVCFAEFLSSFTTDGIKMVDSRSAYLLEVTAVGLNRPQKHQPTNKPQPPAKEWKCEDVLSADSSYVSSMLRDEQEESQELLGIGRA